MDRPDRHCTKCLPGRICGKYHVYVIELKKSVLKEKTFLAKNKHLPEGYKGRCFYVGQTAHVPECRYKQHVAKESRRNRENGGFMCACFSKESGEATLRPFKPRNSPGKFVNKYHKKGGLKPVFYKELNPVGKTKKESEAAEKKLAQDLRNLGYAVHFG
jgi:hypothetical protein